MTFVKRINSLIKSFDKKTIINISELNKEKELSEKETSENIIFPYDSLEDKFGLFLIESQYYPSVRRACIDKLVEFNNVDINKIKNKK